VHLRPHFGLGAGFSPSQPGTSSGPHIALHPFFSMTPIFLLLLTELSFLFFFFFIVVTFPSARASPSPPCQFWPHGLVSLPRLGCLGDFVRTPLGSPPSLTEEERATNERTLLIPSFFHPGRFKHGPFTLFTGGTQGAYLCESPLPEDRLPLPFCSF